MNHSFPDLIRRDWLVLATVGELAIENRCFAPHIGRGVPGGGVFSALAEAARERGWESLTLDRAEAALAAGVTPGAIHLVSDMGVGLDSESGRRAASRALYCFESPLQSKAFHLRLARVSAQFDSAYLFGGLVRFSRACRTSAAHFPVEDRAALASAPAIEQREFLVAICGRKSALAWTQRAQFGAWHALARDAFYLAARQVHPILGAPDYYVKRKQVIEALGPRRRIAVYGQGWESSSIAATPGVWQGSVGYPKKLQTLARYRFCLCFENCGFPGYVTEKIYDCFLAGTIPVYFGAPDISERIPKQAYIDYRELGTPERLLSHLDGLDPGRLRDLQAAGAAVLQSEEFARTAPRSVARQILG